MQLRLVPLKQSPAMLHEWIETSPLAMGGCKADMENPPELIRASRMAAEEAAVRQTVETLKCSGASCEARLQMDPDSVVKVLVEIVKALPAQYGAFIVYCLHDGVGAWRVAMARLMAQGVELTGRVMVYSYHGWDHREHFRTISRVRISEEMVQLFLSGKLKVRDEESLPATRPGEPPHPTANLGEHLQAIRAKLTYLSVDAECHLIVPSKQRMTELLGIADETMLTPEILTDLENAHRVRKELSKHKLGKTVGAGAAGQLLEELVGYEVVREAGFATGLRAVVWTSLCIDFIRFKSNKAQTQNA